MRQVLCKYEQRAKNTRAWSADLQACMSGEIEVTKASNKNNAKRVKQIFLPKKNTANPQLRVFCNLPFHESYEHNFHQKKQRRTALCKFMQINCEVIVCVTYRFIEGEGACRMNLCESRFTIQI
jgi:23S rRNA A1618 N6-methylase RlmF